RGSPGQRRFRDRDQSGHFPQVLGCGSQEELILCSIWSSEAQAIQLEDAFEVREQHLDLLSLAAGGQIGVGLRQVASQIAGAFMDRAQYLSAGVARTAA